MMVSNLPKILKKKKFEKQALSAFHAKFFRNNVALPRCQGLFPFELCKFVCILNNHLDVIIIYRQGRDTKI